MRAFLQRPLTCARPSPRRSDGGEHNAAINVIKARLQPQAIMADGTQLPNVARLVGSESGYAPYPTWSTADGPDEDGSGDPLGSVFVPAEADTPVTMRDLWFWKPDAEYRSLSSLKGVYRNTVGANALLEIGVVPDNTGNIPPEQLAVLQALGDYVRACHSPAAAAAAAAPVAAMSVNVSIPGSATIDRVIIEEDLAFGARVLAFDVTADVEGGYKHVPVLVAGGTAIGHKRILYFQSGPVNTTGVTVTATQLRAGADVPHWRALRAYTPCALD